MPSAFTQAERLRHLWARIDRSGGPDVCWPWTGGRSMGYGMVSWRDAEDGPFRNQHAHTLVFELLNGWRPKKQKRRVLRHLCHNKLCCNPAHLVPGTQKDNAKDNAEAGRQAVGEATSNAQYSATQMEEVYALLGKGERQCDVIRLTGVSRAQVHRAAHRQTWVHLARAEDDEGLPISRRESGS